jgi:NACHT domain
VIVHFDFQSADSSRDAANAIDRLRGILAPAHRDQAVKIWDHLIAKAGELIPVGGGATRATLVDALNRAQFPVGAARWFWRDIETLNRECKRALSDIKSTIHGLHLHRVEAYQDAREALAEGRFVQLSGEPGCGKSALLKGIAEECARNGPVFVLKDTRIHPKGWSAHAHVLGVSDDIVALLREFSCSGEPILFIDGIDKIVDPAVQLTVNDVLKAIADNNELSAWRVLATVREQNLKHLETWLDGEALKKLHLRNAAVASLHDDELAVVASAFPRLRTLLTQAVGVDVILRRPFYLKAILNLAGRDASSGLPATEVELVRLWWHFGASDRTDFSAAQHRRNVLLDLADRLSRAPNSPIAIRNVAPEQLDELKASGVIRDKQLGHSVVFAHDI